MTDLRFDVKPLADELAAQPDIWNVITHRTDFDTSPHREVDDIWVRYNPYKNWGPDFNAQHESLWYPVADRLTSAKKLCFELCQQLDTIRLGGVLITRVPAGKQVYPHIDHGWHARYYEKYIIQIKGNSEQAFCFEGEQLSAQPGECYWFDNAFEHWVTNHSDEERISLIVCVRRDLCH